MKKIEVLHCTGSGMLPKLISMFTNSHITHTAIRIIENGEPYIYEMQENGLTRKMESSWVAKYHYKYKVTEHEITLFKFSWLKRNEGVLKYDKGTLIVSQPLLQAFGVWIGNKQKSVSDGMICSEMVAFVLSEKEWWKQTPKSLHKLCTDENNKQ
jgi:hypothetical protein